MSGIQPVMNAGGKQGVRALPGHIGALLQQQRRPDPLHRLIRQGIGQTEGHGLGQAGKVGVRHVAAVAPASAD